MGLAFSIILVLFILPIIFGVYFLFRVKKLGILLLAIPVIVTIVIAGWWVYELNHHFVSSTDLSAESIDNISLYEPLDQAFKETYGAYDVRENMYFDTLFQFEHVLVGADEAEEIVYIRTNSPEMYTAQGISIGNQLEDIYEAYGQHYYKYTEMGQADSINYVDRDLRLHLQFSYENNKVIEITLTEM